MNKAVFLDRDGVLLHNRESYITDWEQVKIYPYAFAALSRLAKSDYKIFLLTNQSAIGRGLVALETVEEINRRLESIVSQHGGRIDEVFLCPHAPADRCHCRKPLPGMIEEAHRKYDLNLAQSWLIGDALSDLQAGVVGGIENLILVQTGRGKKQLVKFNNEFSNINFQVQTNVLKAVDAITTRKH